MRRSALFIIGCALSLFIGVAPAAADNGPHVKGAGLTPDTCAACHRAHTAQAAYLLKEDQEALCFTCHGATGTGSNEDVVNGVGWNEAGRSGPAGALRGGGFEYALINTANPEPVYEETYPYRLKEATIPTLAVGEKVSSTHSANESVQTAWGNGAISATVNYGKGISLACGSCHNPHGNETYRILKPIPDESGAATEVKIADAATKAYTTSNYWKAWDTNQPQYRWKVSEWCSTCHTRYLTTYSKTEPAYKTSSGDAVYNYRHGTGYTQLQYEELEAKTPNKTKPNCVQCHVSHGSNASMGTNSQSVTWPDGSAAGTDSRLLRLDNRGVCQTCHHK